MTFEEMWKELKRYLGNDPSMKMLSHNGYDNGRFDYNQKVRWLMKNLEENGDILETKLSLTNQVDSIDKTKEIINNMTDMEFEKSFKKRGLDLCRKCG